MQGRRLITICKRFPLLPTLVSKLHLANYKNSSGLAVNSINFNDIPQKEEVFSFTGRGNEDLMARFLSMLRACHDPLDLQKGRQVHAQLVVNGVDDDDSLGTRLLGMYVLCRSFSDAKDVFFRLKKVSPLPWNWMIRGFTMVGWFNLALLFYIKMWFVGALPDKYTFPYVIKSCCNLSAVGLGRLIHKTICLMGLEADLFVGSSLIKMYAEGNFIDEAREVFDRMPERDCVLWNVMIDGYVRNGDRGNAVKLFNSMRRTEIKPNSVAFAGVLSICAAEAMLKYGIQLHGLTIRCGLDLEASVANTLLAMYSKCRCFTDMKKLFDLMPQADLVAWNGMISGYVQHGLRNEALDLFYQMQAAGIKPDSITLASFLPAFSDLTSLKQGKDIHAYIIRNSVCMDAFLKSALIDIYFKCKDVRMAQKVFDATGAMDVVICSAMISGYVLNGMNRDALGMFRWLLEAQLKPNAITVSSVLPACSCLFALKLGKELHGYILKNAFEGKCYVGSALMDMYAKCGRLDLGHQIFTKLSERDTIAWNSMITSFNQNGQPKEAISLFRQMGSEELRYDCVTISSALSACASLPALHYGKEIHGFMARGSLRDDLYAVSALIDMYSKCGNLDIARCVFDSMQEKNEVSWNSIIAAYGTHGLVKDAVSLFQQMQNAGFQPDHITFLALISACGHAGQIEEGFRFFHCMTEEYGIAARMEHYACMVDLYGRAGKLDKALNFITSMPFKPDAGIWGVLLGACRVHGNIALADLASKQLFELDPCNSGYYVLMSNIHAVAGRWDGVSKVRSLMKERKVQKVPGCSWIEINNINHIFVAADQSHPDSSQIYLLLKCIILELIEEGYVPQPDFVYPLNMNSNKQVDS
ncbi:pentatricopeptide repeat-containing protein At4g21300 [Phoenix dactylifera]|uniref:Pentatricopeptide repeat-containing protein At4g21300 n=1 Tax=Phoenix dactylifera TaxID=42345 RepID=A0A8B7C806_PHODC|nr:pentatricopeptide repeat-containing protein At4g21300 [Phoenix dactylifera]